MRLQSRQLPVLTLKELVLSLQAEQAARHAHGCASGDLMLAECLGDAVAATRGGVRDGTEVAHGARKLMLSEKLMRGRGRVALQRESRPL